MPFPSIHCRIIDELILRKFSFHKFNLIDINLGFTIKKNVVIKNVLFQYQKSISSISRKVQRDRESYSIFLTTSPNVQLIETKIHNKLLLLLNILYQWIFLKIWIFDDFLCYYFFYLNVITNCKLLFFFSGFRFRPTWPILCLVRLVHLAPCV